MRLCVPNLYDKSLRAVIGEIGRIFLPGQEQLCDNDLCIAS
jgi:hypothetical protein